MRTDRSIPTRVVCLLLALCLAWQTGCSSRTVWLSPRDASDRYRVFDDVQEIVVVEKNGAERSFASGRIEDDIFHGVDAEGNTLAIPLQEISMFKLTRHDGGRSTLQIVGIVVAGIVVIGLVILAIASCPHVYSDDGTGFVLDAEPYSGALAASAKRTDVQVLDHLRERDGTYRLQLVNEVQEVEYTDHVRVLVADAAPGTQVVPDGRGGVLGVAGWELPIRATARTGEDLLARLDAHGEFLWEGDPLAEYAEGRPRETVDLVFRRPPGATHATFLLRGNNTQWGMWVMQDFLNRFGKGARDRLERLGTDPAGKEKIESWLQRNGIWLEVQMKHDGTWETAGWLREVGATVVETQALRIALPPGGGEELELRLRWAPLLWNLMRVGVDWSDPAGDVAVQPAALLEALDARRGDVRHLLEAEDGRPYRAVQGDVATLVFRAPPPTPGRQRTLLVEASGHYELVLPDGDRRKLLASLEQAIRRQGLDAYSLERLREAAGRDAR